MKTIKKDARKQLEKFSTIFTQLGLVLALFIVFIALEHKTKKEIAVIKPSENQSYEPVYTFKQPVVLKKVNQTDETPKKRTVIKQIEKPQIVDNNTEITTVIKMPVEEPTININSINQEKEDEDINIEDDPVSINNVQKTPVFKGCEGLSEEENRKCFEQKMQQHIQRNFNVALAQEVGLNSGKYKILTQFVIDKSGKVVDVKIRAPHSRLRKETDRVVHKIPQFQPGKQNDKEVKVKYTLPITFRVE